MYSKMDSPKLSVLEQESMTRKQNDPDIDGEHERSEESVGQAQAGLMMGCGWICKKARTRSPFFGVRVESCRE